MISQDVINRLQTKTPQQRFIQMLEQEFQFAPKIAQVILEEAQASLTGQISALKPGQTRVILAKREAHPGRPLRETEKTQVTWTVDAGTEDLQVKQQHGQTGLRRVRIQRLVLEAVEQGKVDDAILPVVIALTKTLLGLCDEQQRGPSGDPQQAATCASA